MFIQDGYFNKVIYYVAINVAPDKAIFVYHKNTSSYKKK